MNGLRKQPVFLLTPQLLCAISYGDLQAQAYKYHEKLDIGPYWYILVQVWALLLTPGGGS